MKAMIVIATVLGVMLSVAAAESAMAGIGTSPGKTVSGGGKGPLSRQPPRSCGPEGLVRVASPSWLR